MRLVALHDRFRRGLGQALLVVLFCSVGCKRSTPARPVNVAASAVWVANEFIECTVEAETNANRCSVRDAKGVLLGDGLFILNNDGRAAANSELKYVAFREGRIYLTGERFLYPTLPPEQDRAGSRTGNFRRGFSLSPSRRKTRFLTSTVICQPQLCRRANSISTSALALSEEFAISQMHFSNPVAQLAKFFLVTTVYQVLRRNSE